MTAIRTMIHAHRMRPRCSAHSSSDAIAVRSDDAASGTDTRKPHCERLDMATTGLNHFTILTDDVPRTVQFYGELLGLPTDRDRRSAFPEHGSTREGRRSCTSSADGRARSCAPGVIDHMAFSAIGPRGDARGARCTRHVEYVCRQQKGSGIWQVFFHDPNGAKVELDFAAEEAAPQMTGSAPDAALDHLVVAAATLADGIEYVAGITGVAPHAGGKHVAMGTHNALLRLGERIFLELIAIDPDGSQARSAALVRSRQHRASSRARRAAATHPLGRAHDRYRARRCALPDPARADSRDIARRLSMADHDSR